MLPPPSSPDVEIEWCGARKRPLQKDAAALEKARHRVELRGLERLITGEVGQDGGQPAGEHGLARPGRSHHEEVVAARGRDLQRTARLGLSAHLGEVVGHRERWCRGPGVDRRR
jgi:hypothetical protein